MGIAFSKERFDIIKHTYNAWWNHELNRPVTGAIIMSREPNRKEPDIPLLSQANSNDLSISAESIVDRIDYELSKNEYYGDAYPMFNMDCFGPGVIAAFLGAKLDNSTGSVWFHAPEKKHISELHFEYDPTNPWLVRIKDIYKCAVDRWEGKVMMGMTDLGGVMDILSSFRTGEDLLFDLYDEPQEVKRLVNEISVLWHKFYEDLNSVLTPINPGYSDWSGIYSDVPSYILQCDFSYMLSPDMFREFILDEVRQSCKKLDRSIWHLDGIGELAHLDYLLSIKELNGIQWVPGAGNAPCHEWLEIYRKIKNSGKLLQIMSYNFEELSQIIHDLGDSKGIQHPSLYFSANDKDYALQWLKKLEVI